MGPNSSLRIKGYMGGLTGSSYVEKVDTTTYVGTDHYTIDENGKETKMQSIQKTDRQFELKAVIIELK